MSVMLSRGLESDTPVEDAPSVGSFAEFCQLLNCALVSSNVNYP